ncbi:MAG: NitT/TauT family transport system permease protein [Verrucomicrobiota bacterium]
MALQLRHQRIRSPSAVAANASRIAPILAVIGLCHLLWFAAVSVFGIRSIFLPGPVETYTVLTRLLFHEEFWLDVGASWLRVSVAFLLSLAVSYPLVLAALSSDQLRRSLFVIVEFFRYLPVPIFVPLTILWFGVADTGKVVVIFLGTFCQMIPMFYDSALIARRSYGAAAFSLKWRQWDEIRNIAIPGSAPQVFDSSRICLGWAWTYLVVAELLGAPHGIGYAIIRAQRYLATDRIFAYVIVIGLMGVLTDRVLRYVRGWVFAWA